LLFVYSFCAVNVVCVYGIADAKASLFFFRKRKVTKRKLPAAPASLNVSAFTSGVVAEPDDAGF